MESALLGLPYIMPAQAQKHVTHNEAIRTLDALVQLSVRGRTSGSAPVAPGEGDRHIVAPGATGAWQGEAGQVAIWQDGAWTFLRPREGWLAWVEAENALVVHAGGDWRLAEGGAANLQNVPLIGVGTEADEANPFSAKLNSALWTARPVAEGGTGDLRYVLNKDAPGGVLSMLFASGYSGRAELGLVDGENFGFKVSADGSAWRRALTIDRRAGDVRAEAGLSVAKELVVMPQTPSMTGLPDGALWQDEASGRVMVKSAGRTSPLGSDLVPLVRSDPGRWVRAANASTTTTTTLTSPPNRVTLYPYVARSDFDLARVGVNVTGAAAGAFARVSLYGSDPAGRPAALLAETAPFSCAAAGSADAALSLALKASQQVWVAVRTSEAVTLSAWQAYNSPDLDAATISVAVNKTLQRAIPFDQALPAVWVYAAGESASGGVPAVWLRMA